MKWWYAYVPLLHAGSGGNRLVGKFQATADDVQRTFAGTAHINYENGVIECYARPRANREDGTQ